MKEIMSVISKAVAKRLKLKWISVTIRKVIVMKSNTHVLIVKKLISIFVPCKLMSSKNIQKNTKKKMIQQLKNNFHVCYLENENILLYLLNTFKV